MIPLPAFPRARGTLSQETYLTLLLLALVDQAGGELHLSAPSLDKVDAGGKLTIDWDVEAQQLVLRSASPSLVIAEVRGTGWTTQPTAPASLQPPPPPPPPSSHRVLTEEDLIARVAKKIQDDRMREWRQQGADAVASMPPPEEPSR